MTTTTIVRAPTTPATSRRADYDAALTAALAAPGAPAHYAGMRTHTTAGGATYLLASPIPDAPKPSADAVRKYVAARRLRHAHYHEVDVRYWEPDSALEKAITKLSEQQSDRFSKKRDAALTKLHAERDALHDRWGQISAQVNWACHVIQDFKQSVYGCWFNGGRGEPYRPWSRRHYADNYARSYGQLTRLEAVDAYEAFDAAKILAVECDKCGCWHPLTTTRPVWGDDHATRLQHDLDGLRTLDAHFTAHQGHYRGLLRWTFTEDHAD